MYQRMPGTLKDALTEIKQALGAEHMAEIVGKTGSLMQKWTNPEHEAGPNVLQARLLDTACQLSNGKTPILSWYQSQLGEPSSAQKHRNLQSEALDVVTSTGRLISRIQQVTDPASPKARGLSLNEAAEVLQATKELRAQIDDVDAAVRPFTAH